METDNRYKNKSSLPLRRIISGGQTGADRAALETARRLGFATGGTVPKGFGTAKGPDPTLAQFGVTEDASSEYPSRTVKNVRDADGTVWFGNQKTPGGKLTLGTARRMGKPLMVNPSPSQLADWIKENHIETLNVAGDRAENDPDIYGRVEDTLVLALAKGRG